MGVLLALRCSWCATSKSGRIHTLLPSAYPSGTRPGCTSASITPEAAWVMAVAAAMAAAEGALVVGLAAMIGAAAACAWVRARVVSQEARPYAWEAEGCSRHLWWDEPRCQWRWPRGFASCPSPAANDDLGRRCHAERRPPRTASSPRAVRWRQPRRRSPPPPPLPPPPPPAHAASSRSHDASVWEVGSGACAAGGAEHPGQHGEPCGQAISWRVCRLPVRRSPRCVLSQSSFLGSRRTCRAQSARLRQQRMCSAAAPWGCCPCWRA